LETVNDRMHPFWPSPLRALPMIGLVLVTHGRLAEEFRRAVVHVVGEQEAIVAICIEADDNVQMRRDDIVAAIAQVDRGHGVILLTDMFGGTPSNLAISVMQTGKIEVLAGLNLPMLVKIARARATNDMAATLKAGHDAGRKYINIASQVLSGQ
jgi:mannose PTS system EIIA component